MTWYEWYWLSKVKLSAKERNQLRQDQDCLQQLMLKDDQGLTIAVAKRELQRYGQDGISVLMPGMDEYEACFRSFQDRVSLPYLLYIKGEVALLRESFFGLVGSRRAGSYDLSLCRKLVASSKGSGFGVVSGGAYGIDGQAHRSALALNLPTVCVLGSGFYQLYPKAHKELFEEISKKGLLLSEYPPEVAARPYHFPERNRLIALLSEPLVVVCASLSSGSLSTAEIALDLGKTVLTLPHRLEDDFGGGCHFLANSGVPLLENYDNLKMYLSRKAPL